jgi:ATP-dependent RNA helicase DeaD
MDRHTPTLLSRGSRRRKLAPPFSPCPVFSSTLISAPSFLLQSLRPLLCEDEVRGRSNPDKNNKTEHSFIPSLPSKSGKSFFNFTNTSFLFDISLFYVHNTVLIQAFLISKAYMSQKTFAQLGLSTEILHAIEKKGFTHPSPVQEGVIPLLLSGDRDIIGQAQTGTGKTAAFALPLLERLDAEKKQTQAIVLTPTRELAIQVAKEIRSFSVAKSPTVTVVYGGNNMRGEIAELRKSPNIVVGTPGRMQHHIRNKALRLDDIQYFVLDEADEMLNFGFREEIEEILEKTPKQRRVLLFSATMPKSIMNIVHNYMHDHDIVKAESSEMTNANITQKYYCIQPEYRFEALCRVMEYEETFYAIVFCRTKSDTEFVASQLVSKHLRAAAIHGDIDQASREKTLCRFKEGKINILVATDVAARGIDVSELNFVVNYSLPESYESYTHRIGRTGRAGKTGTAITFVTAREVSRIHYFERNLKAKIEKGILPTPNEIVEKKKFHLIERLEHIVNNENMEYLLPLAQQLLDEGNPVEVIAALLKDSYQSDFNPHTYPTIRDDSGNTASPKKKQYGGGYKGRGRNPAKSGGYRRKNTSRSSGGYGKSGGGKKRGGKKRT